MSSYITPEYFKYREDRMTGVKLTSIQKTVMYSNKIYDIFPPIIQTFF